jgi:CubicO group peptidase (beta-lactamase class C family)
MMRRLTGLWCLIAHPTAFQRLDSLLSTVISERITPGFAITVIYRDTLVYNKGWGGLQLCGPANALRLPIHFTMSLP